MSVLGRRAEIKTPRSARDILLNKNKQISNRRPANLIIHTDSLHLNVDKSKHYGRKSKMILSPLQLSPPSQFNSPFEIDEAPKNDFNEVVIVNNLNKDDLSQLISMPPQKEEKSKPKSESKFIEQFKESFMNQQMNLQSQLSKIQGDFNLHFHHLNQTLNKIEEKLDMK